ncbi:helix-hairpin-helix domain-containing protein [Methanosphaera stadtmanae]|nr:helix-hairpin-helix domain-containing protein [Methanosphaera stadtmanae]
MFGNNLNDVKITELTRIDGIGEVTARNIIEFYNNME